MNGLGKPFRKKSNKKFKLQKINEKMPHEKKTLARKQVLV